jgi:serine protease Do
MGAQQSAWHGIVPKTITLASAKQCVVGQLDAESPAAKCGLLPGDIISRMGDSPVLRALDIERAILGHEPGEEIAVSVQRDKESVQVKLVLSPAAKRTTEGDRIWDLIGLRLVPAPVSQLKGYHKQYRGGLVVTEVRPESPAAQEGILRGDVLLGMQIYETISLDNVNYILKNSDPASLEALKFLILRDNVRYEGELVVSRKQGRTR